MPIIYTLHDFNQLFQTAAAYVTEEQITTTHVLLEIKKSKKNNSVIVVIIREKIVAVDCRISKCFTADSKTFHKLPPQLERLDYS